MNRARKGWTLDDIPWDRFDPHKVDPDILRVVKAASLVEYNGDDYAAYLCGVFHDDPEFQRAARHWAREEVQHGKALARWARMAEPGYDFERSFERFSRKIRLPTSATKSVRGSRSSELIARCIVEVGTSSYYSALAEATEEPVLKAICKNIAGDELRHYKLFYTHLKRYREIERPRLWRRLWVTVCRFGESEDDELAYAYYAANAGADDYHRRRFNHAYARRAYGYYRPHHVEFGMAMVFKAIGLKPHGRLCLWATRLAYRFLSSRVRRLAAAGA